MVSVVLPTYNESENIRKIVHELSKYVPDAQIVIVDDDSPDGTGRIADELSKENKILVIHRREKLGLGSAIAEGFNAAQGDIVGVMDADGSHPAWLVPKLIGPLLDGDFDIVIASRKINGGGVEKWGIQRQLISWGATMLSRPLTKVRDPMSGFFFLNKSVINDITFGTRGYKILLEILAKNRQARTKEIPFIFKGRVNGQSKLGFKEHLDYLSDVVRLYLK